MKNRLLQIFWLIIAPLMLYILLIIIYPVIPLFWKALLGIALALWTALVLYLMYDYTKAMNESETKKREQ